MQFAVYWIVYVREKKLKRFYYCFLNITEKYAFCAKATFEYNWNIFIHDWINFTNYFYNRLKNGNAISYFKMHLFLLKRRARTTRIIFISNVQYNLIFIFNLFLVKNTFLDEIRIYGCIRNTGIYFKNERGKKLQKRQIFNALKFDIQRRIQSALY